MKIFDFFEKNKGLIGALAAILIVLAMAVAFYGYRIDNSKDTPRKVYTVGNVEGFEGAIEVPEGEKVVQTYSLKVFPYTKMGIHLYSTSSKSNVKVQIEYDSQKIEKELSKEEFSSEGYTYIDLPKEFVSTNPSKLMISLTAEDGSFFVAKNSTTEIEDSNCELGGAKISDNIVVELRAMRNISEYVFYWVFVVIGILLLAAIFLLVKYKKASIEGIVSIVTTYFCLACMFIFPPATVPDEPMHYRSAYHVSNQMLFNFDDEQGALCMRSDDLDYYNNYKISLFDQDYITDMGFDSIKCKNTEIVTGNIKYFENKAIVYFFPATGITLSRIIGLGPYWTFQMARLFNIVQSIIMVYFAIKIIPYGKGALAAISLLPINLHIRSSVSYDAFTYGGTLMIFAYIIKLIYDKKPISWKQMILLAIMIIIVVPQKVVYIGVAALLLIIPKERFAKPKWHLVFKCALGAIAILSVLLIQFGEANLLISDTVSYSDETPGFSLMYIIAHIPQILNMLFNTIIDNGDFYVQSMISFFGWFELSARWFMIIPLYILLAISFMRSEDEPAPQRTIERIYSLALFILVFILTEFVLLVAHTPIDSSTIEGVQGRYFLPALPLLFVAVRNNTIVLKKNFEGQLIFALSALNIITFIYCMASIIPA